MPLDTGNIIYAMDICAVHIQVLQKSKTVCFTSSSKGTYVILPFERKFWSSFPAEDETLFWHPHSLCWAVQEITGEGGGKSLLNAGRSRSVDHLKKLWTDHKGNRAELWSRQTGTKAIVVWGGISPFSSTSRCCYWTDRWNPLLLEKGRVCRWGTHTTRTPSVGHLKSWARMRKSRSADFPAELCPRSKISRGENCILIHVSILHSSELYDIA